MFIKPISSKDWSEELPEIALHLRRPYIRVAQRLDAIRDLLSKTRSPGGSLGEAEKLKDFETKKALLTEKGFSRIVES